MKLKKIINIMTISLGIAAPLIATTLATTSCGSESTSKISYWNNFKRNAQRATAFEIVGATKPDYWINYNIQSLSIGDFDIDETHQSITVTIANDTPGSTATFTITFHKKKSYNVDDWKYNNDVQNKFKNNLSFATNSGINQILVTHNSNTNVIHDIIYAAADDGGFWTNSPSSESKNFIKSAQANGIPWTVRVNCITEGINEIYFGTSAGAYTAVDGKFMANPVLKHLNIKLITNIDDDRRVYASTNGGIFISYSSNEEPTFDPDVPTTATVNQITPILENHSYIATNQGLFESGSSSPLSYQKVNISDMPNWTEINKVIDIDGNIFLATNQGLWCSQNQQNFVKITSEIPTKTNILNIVKINDVIYLSTNKGVYISNDDKVFTLDKAISNKLIVHNIQDVNGLIYLMSDNYGVFSSNDDGKTFNSELITLDVEKDNNITEFITVPDSDWIFVITKDNGLWNN